MTNMNIVNECIRESFGILYSGGWKTAAPNPYAAICSFDSETTPNNIAKKPLWAIIISFPYCFEPRVRFIDHDATKLQVKSKYKKAAETYAKLYEEKTSKKVSLELISNNVVIW